MELAELVQLRPVPGAGLLLCVTRRCPLDCAHCSTASTMAGARPLAEELLRFVGSFGSLDRPEVVLLTGGEPLLYPDLVAALATHARRAGSRTAVLTGAFFAARRRLPARIRSAVRAVDHFSVSLDVYHERRVSRADVFALLRTVLSGGTPVSVHAVGDGPDDPYLADLSGDVRRVFGAQVPMLVNTLRPVGRAASWAAARRAEVDREQVLPCAMAAWPLVAADGAVLACCNQDVVDRRPAPEHLALGYIGTDGWPAVRARLQSSPELRAIRTVGPAYLRGDRRPGPGGYCAGCRRLAEHPEVLALARRIGGGPAGELLDRHAAVVQRAAGPAAFVRRHGCAPYADLVAGAGAGGT